MSHQPPRHGRPYAIGAARFETEPLGPGLYIVATPIGNLGDITVRALATLAAAEVILCEDTRTTARLLERYAIRTRTAPYHEHNAEKVRPGILERLAAGATIALVSDAGMPLVSDPGYRLVKEAVDRGIAVTACPGASAVLTGLALSGLPTDRFLFAGFMPQKQGERTRMLAEFAQLRATLIVFESPHRIVETLEDLGRLLPDRPVAVARELTKLHEEVLRGAPGGIAAALSARPSVKGEITLLIGPAPDKAPATDADIDEAIASALETMPAGRAAAHVARELGLPKSAIYERILARKGGGDA